MAREDLTPGSRHIYFQVFPDNNSRNKNNGGCEFQYRQVKDSLMKAIYPKNSAGTPEFPVAFPNTWIRLQRVNNEFTGYYSTDGKSWKAYTTYTLELPLKIYLGFAVTSHNPGKTAYCKVQGYRRVNALKEDRSISMVIDHVAIWTAQLEKLKEYYVKYFNGRAHKKYLNQERL